MVLVEMFIPILVGIVAMSRPGERAYNATYYQWKDSWYVCSPYGSYKDPIGPDSWNGGTSMLLQTIPDGQTHQVFGTFVERVYDPPSQVYSYHGTVERSCLMTENGAMPVVGKYPLYGGFLSLEWGPVTRELDFNVRRRRTSWSLRECDLSKDKDPSYQGNPACISFYWPASMGRMKDRFERYNKKLTESLNEITTIPFTQAEDRLKVVLDTYRRTAYDADKEAESLNSYLETHTLSNQEMSNNLIFAHGGFETSNMQHLIEINKRNARDQLLKQSVEGSCLFPLPKIGDQPGLDLIAQIIENRGHVSKLLENSLTADFLKFFRSIASVSQGLVRIDDGLLGLLNYTSRGSLDIMDRLNHMIKMDSEDLENLLATQHNRINFSWISLVEGIAGLGVVWLGSKTEVHSDKGALYCLYFSVVFIINGAVRPMVYLL